MAGTQQQPGGRALWTRVTLRCYDAAQKLLPAPLVRAHGEEMRRAFEEHLLEARDRGHATAPILLHALRDVAAHAISARLHRASPAERRRRMTLNRERVIMLLNDMRLAARGLIRRPGFTIVATLTLALGIGATVAMFAVVHSVLIRPLPFPEPDRLVWIQHHAPGLSQPTLESSPGTLAVYRDQARSLAHVASVQQTWRNMSGSARPVRLEVAIVSPSLFDVLRVPPILGRGLTQADAVEGAPPVAVLTHRAWQTHFGGAQDVIGRSVELDGVTTEIVGVMPSVFTYPVAATDALLPEAEVQSPQFGAFGTGGLARLAPGVDLATAQAELSALQPRHIELYSLPEDFLESASWSVSVRPLHDVTVGSTAAMLWIVLGTAGFLLLVACSSVASLFLVRAEARQREIGVRLALGATRGRIASTLLSESLLIGVAGGLWGVVMAWHAVQILVANGPPQLPRLHEVELSAPVLALAAAVSVAVSLLFGLLPLSRKMRQTAPAALRAGRSVTGGRTRQRLRRGLIVGQIALALVLLTGSALMLQSFQHLRSVDSGVDAHGVLLLGVSGSEGTNVDHNTASYLDMLLAARELPDVNAAGVATSQPILPASLTGGGISIESRPTAEGELPLVAFFTGITDGYLEAVGTPLLEGRDLTPAEVIDRSPVVLVSEHFSRTHLDGSALGERIRIGDSVWREIVGVVGDVRTFGPREDLQPMAYLPITSGHASVQTAQIVIRTEGQPMAVAPALRSRVQEIDPNAPVLAVRTLQSVLDDSVADMTFASTILTTAAFISLLLGAIGLYGIVSFAVAARRSEIGMRLALGATSAVVVRTVLREGMLLGGSGVILGLTGAAALTRLLDSMLFEVSTHDPLVFGLVALVLLTVTLLATWLPAHRAASIDPVEAMRDAG